jgi:hypothetical protein
MADVELMFFNCRRAKVFGYKSTTTDELILKRSMPDTHVEIKFSSRHGGYSWSATMADGVGGCRFKDINFSHGIEFWDRIVMHWTDEQEAAAWRLACAYADLPLDWHHSDGSMFTVSDGAVTVSVGTKLCYYGPNHIKYDLKGQLAHLLPLRIIKPAENKTWCSKAVCQACFVAEGVELIKMAYDRYRVDELRPDQLSDLILCYQNRKDKKCI